MWHYFQAFEAQHGAISDILAVETQWQAAVPQSTPVAAAYAALDRVRRRFTHFGLWPCTVEQQAHLASVLPASSSDTPGGAAAPAAKCALSPKHIAGNQVIPGALPFSRAPCVCSSDGAGGLSAALDLFISKLPKALEVEQPVPDIDYVISIIMQSAPAPTPLPDEPQVGTKRSLAAVHKAAVGAPTDIFHMRHHQRAKAEGGRG